MAYIELVIKVPEHCFEELKCVELNESNEGVVFHAIKCILNGTPLPKGHGELIDRSKVIKSLFDYHNAKKTIGQCIDDVPTIIEADKEIELESN